MKRVHGTKDYHVFEVTLSLDTGIYASGDVLADTQEIESAFSAASAFATIEGIKVLDKDDQGQAFDVVLLTANHSLGTENSAPDITDTEAEDVIACINVLSTDYFNIGSMQVANVVPSGLGHVIQAGATTSLYIGAISKGTGTYTASGLIVTLTLAWVT